MVVAAYLKLVRWPNLLFIALVQYATRHFVIEPMLVINGYTLLMSHTHFACLVAACVFIAAGGYAINDYFDAKIDRVNKPKTVVVDRLIPRRVAMAAHIAFTALGFVLATYVSYRCGMWRMASLFGLAIVALWFYSTNLKHQFLTGNLCIAVMAGFVPLIVGLLEIPLQNAAHPESVQQLGYSVFNAPALWTTGFAACFFLLTLAREITKDIIDIRGDKMFGCRTIPIVAGVPATKAVLMGLYLFTAAAMLVAYYRFIGSGQWQITVATAAIAGLLALQVPLIFRAKSKPEFTRSAWLNIAASVLVPVAMLVLKLTLESVFQPPTP